MRFSLIATALAFAFSVSAGAFDKRSTDTCVVSLTVVSSQLTTVTNGFNAYTASQGYAGAVAIQTQIKNLETKVDSASSTSNCCFGFVISENDASTIIGELDYITSQIEAALAALVGKKPIFGPIPLVVPLFKNELGVLKTYIDKLLACLLAATPADLISTVQGYIDRINAAFGAAGAAYA